MIQIIKITASLSRLLSIAYRCIVDYIISVGLQFFKPVSSDLYSPFMYHHHTFIIFPFISLFSLKFQFKLGRFLKHSRQCLTIFPNTSKFVKNIPLRIVFSAVFLVFQKRSNMVFHVRYDTSKSFLL